MLMNEKLNDTTQKILCEEAVCTCKHTLKKKAQSIAFHFIREGCAADEWRTTYINTSENISDLMTKPLSGENPWRLIRMLLRHI